MGYYQIFCIFKGMLQPHEKNSCQKLKLNKLIFKKIENGIFLLYYTSIYIAYFCFCFILKNMRNISQVAFFLFKIIKNAELNGDFKVPKPFVNAGYLTTKLKSHLGAKRKCKKKHSVGN